MSLCPGGTATAFQVNNVFLCLSFLPSLHWLSFQSFYTCLSLYSSIFLSVFISSCLLPSQPPPLSQSFMNEEETQVRSKRTIVLVRTESVLYYVGQGLVVGWNMCIMTITELHSYWPPTQCDAQTLRGESKA